MILVQIEVALFAIPIFALLREVSTDARYVGFVFLIGTFPMSSLLLIMAPKIWAYWQAERGVSQTRPKRGAQSSGEVRVTGLAPPSSGPTPSGSHSISGGLPGPQRAGNGGGGSSSLQFTRHNGQSRAFSLDRVKEENRTESRVSCTSNWDDDDSDNDVSLEENYGQTGREPDTASILSDEPSEVPTNDADNLSEEGVCTSTQSSTAVVKEDLERDEFDLSDQPLRQQVPSGATNVYPYDKTTSIILSQQEDLLSIEI